MLLSPIHNIIINKSRIFEQILEQSFDPNIVRLLFKLKSFDIIKVSLKLLCKIDKKIPGNPSHKFWIEIEAFFYLIFSYLYYGDYSSFLLSQGRLPFKKYMIRYPKDYKSSLLEVPF